MYFLNDTPVLKSSADSTNPVTTDFNFQDVTFNPRFGTSGQTKVEGIESSSSVTSVGVNCYSIFSCYKTDNKYKC